MSQKIFLSAIKSQPKKLNLALKDIDALPPIVGQVRSLESLNLKSNRLDELPIELATLGRDFHVKNMVYSLGCRIN